MGVHPQSVGGSSRGRAVIVGKRSNGNGKRKPRLLTRAALDGRTNAAKAFDKLAADIYADMGGRDRLSAIELELVEAFCGSATALRNLNARLILGQKIDLGEHAQVVGTMVKVGSRLGLQRRQREVQSLDGYLLSKQQTRVVEAAE